MPTVAYLKATSERISVKTRLSPSATPPPPPSVKTRLSPSATPQASST